jgi:hypothetical protein
MELKALCKKLREDSQKLKEEKATLEGIIESHDELIMEIATEIGLDRMQEDAEDEDKEDEDADEIIEEGPMEMVPEQEALVAHEVILADDKPEMSQRRPYHGLMRDYEESPSRMMEYLHDLDDDPNEGRSDMDEWFSEDASNDRD